jgi:phage protein U
MLCQIGTIIFERLKTPTSWGTSADWNWQDLARIAGKPASQAIASNLQSHEIAGTFDASFCNVPVEVDRLFEVANAMKSVAFFTGDGYISKVTIRKISIARRVLTKTGGLECVDFTLELREYVDTEARKSEEPWN